MAKTPKYYTVSADDLRQIRYVISELEVYYPNQDDDGFQDMINWAKEFLE
jgi:hypothetical protein